MCVSITIAKHEEHPPFKKQKSKLSSNSGVYSGSIAKQALITHKAITSSTISIVSRHQWRYGKPNTPVQCPIQSLKAITANELNIFKYL